MLGFEPLGRSDLVASREIRQWIRKQQNCVIESDLQVRGRSDAMSFIQMGRQIGIDNGSIIWIADEVGAKPELSIGDRCYLGPYSYVGCHQPITIGANTIIGARAYVISANHQCEPGTPVRDQGYDAAPISIGCDVWIGCHVVVLPGVNIGDGAVIGAGAVVTKGIPAGEKWAGVPARKIGVR